jgi:hypothetical protein
MSVEARMQALLDLVERDRAAQCARIEAEAARQADGVRAQARREARERLHAAVAAERERATQQIAAAQAELQTARRVHAQRRTEALLALGWQALPVALQARWDDAASRAAWTDSALTQARAVLPRTAPWQVQHPTGWADDERERFAAAVAALGAPAPRFAAAPALRAGLRITAAGVVVDASVDGLLADRDEIGGRLIGLLADLPAEVA